MSKTQQATTEHERQGSAWQGAPPPDYPESAPEGATLDLLLNAWLGKFTGGISPAALGNAYADWLSHLALAPSKQQTLLQEAWKKIGRWQQYAVQSALSGGAGAAPCIAPLPQDRRFDDPAGGSAGRTTSSTRASCCSSSGGTAPPRACAASRRTTRTSSPSPCASGWTCWRRRTSC